VRIPSVPTAASRLHRHPPERKGLEERSNPERAVARVGDAAEGIAGTNSARTAIAITERRNHDLPMASLLLRSGGVPNRHHDAAGAFRTRLS
jgi:hypothetical protein